VVYLGLMLLMLKKVKKLLVMHIRVCSTTKMKNQEKVKRFLKNNKGNLYKVLLNNKKRQVICLMILMRMIMELQKKDQRRHKKNLI
jgi:hypothetical protein